jgi:hypothetical protein
LRISVVAVRVKRVRFGGGIVAAGREPGGKQMGWDRRLFAAVLLTFTAGWSTVHGQSEPAPDAPIVAPVELGWQAVITSQIQAFRDRDAPAAFSYAGAGFQTSFPDAQSFFDAIINSGYAPIMESTSHSFGAHQVVEDGGGVLQEVDFIGKAQERYTAVYQLIEEPAGWRVQGVQLVKEAGIAI